MIFIRPLPILTLAASCAILLAGEAAAAPADLSQEYDQIRKIALRDARVREAFDRANERLDAKIVELDPALRNYKPGRTEPTTAVAHQPFTAHLPTPKAAPKLARPVEHHAAPAGSHVVQRGETVDSIARRYRVSASKLEEANHIADPRKLQAGETLVIPKGGDPAQAPLAPAPPKPVESERPAAARPAPADPQLDGIWDKLKKSF